MARYVAFLRGVNVGGVNLKMVAVARALESAGFENVTTVLASGTICMNVPAAARYTTFTEASSNSTATGVNRRTGGRYPRWPNRPSRSSRRAADAAG